MHHGGHYATSSHPSKLVALSALDLPVLTHRERGVSKGGDRVGAPKASPREGGLWNKAGIKGFIKLPGPWQTSAVRS